MNDHNPYSMGEPASPSPEEYSTMHYFKAWISFFLLATIAGAIAGGLAGGLLGFFMAAANRDMTEIARLGQVVGGVAALPVSFFTFRWVVRKFFLRPNQGSQF